MAQNLVSTKVMDALTNIGLNSYERKLYVALLSKGVSTAGNLSEDSSVPRSRCYDVLESLREKGFVVLQNTKPIQYLAVAPSEALDKMKKVCKENYNESVDRIESMKDSDSLKELESVFSNGVEGIAPAEMSGSIKGRKQANQHIETAIKRSKKSLTILTSSQGLQELVENNSKHLKAANERGVKVRIAGHVDKESESHAKALSQFADVRHVANNKSRVMSIDGNEFLMALTSDDTHPSQDMHFWSQSGHVAGTIAEPLFENAWKTARAL